MSIYGWFMVKSRQGVCLGLVQSVSCGLAWGFWFKLILVSLVCLFGDGLKLFRVCLWLILI